MHEYTTPGHLLDPALFAGGELVVSFSGDELVCTGSAQQVPVAKFLSRYR